MSGILFFIFASCHPVNRLLASQHKNTNHKYYCERCLIGYSRQDLLQEHIVECKGINERAIRIEMPTKRNKFVKFENHKNQLKAPWVIYADFEANTTKTRLVFTYRCKPFK